METVELKYDSLFGRVTRIIDGLFEKAARLLAGSRLTPEPTLQPIEPPPELVTETNSLYTDRANQQETIDSVGTILDYASHVFDSMAIPDYLPDLSKSEVKALKRLGPLVVRLREHWDWHNDLTHPEALPSMLFVHLTMLTEFNKECKEKFKRGEDKEEIGNYPEFFYAIKLDKKPIELGHIPGVVYQAGTVYPQNDGSAKEQDNLWWSHYIVVHEGKVVVPKRICGYKEVKIPKKQPSGRKRGRGTYITRREWGYQSTVLCYSEQKDMTKDKAAEHLAHMAASGFNLFSARQDHWRLTMREGAKRVSFLIDQQNPKILFKDRKISARTPTGQKKRIIHYVNGFFRAYGEKMVWVKSHLRGARKFEWKGRECTILAPEFHHMNVDGFDGELVVVTEEEEKAGNYITPKKGMKMLTKAEEEFGTRC